MKERSNLNICMRLIGLVKPLTGFMLLAILLGTVGFLCAIFIPVFGVSALVELVTESGRSLTVLFVCIAVFALLRGALHYGEQACNHYIAFKLLALLRDKVFAALRKLCPAKLEGKDRGNLISIITADIELLEVFYAHTISPIAIAFFVSLIMVLLLGSFHILFALLAVVAYCCVGIIIPMITSKKGKEDGIRFRGESGNLSSFVLDSLRGLSETLQYQAGEKRLEEMNRKTDELSGQEKLMKNRAGYSMAITNTVILFFDLAMLLLCATLYQKGQIGFDGVLIPVVTLMSSFGPVIALANLGSTLQNTFAAGNRVLDILDETPVTEEIDGFMDIKFSDVEVKDVSFSYGGEEILSNISMQMPKKSIIGIVGKSGSGKSTLLKLLMRFWSAQKGEIDIAGRSIDQINTENLRQMESFVTQETHLFHDSIENNIRIAKLDASHEEIVEACKKASVHDFIMKLPKGYDTSVGELGDTLSGGERQRIGLARAFLHNAPLMLLDEPTSNLDSLNEAVILKSIGEEREDKTVVLVSHRSSTMRIADKIYSVENGRMS